MKFTKVLLILALLGTISCNENASIDPEGATITSLACSNATFSVPATSGTSFTATASVPYTGGNGGAYTAGDAVASSGVSGLIATLQAGTLAEGSGTANFIITGTPATSGTANFAIALGSQTCTLALKVAISKSSISSLVCVAAPANGTSGTAYSGNVTMNYTGGNGGVYDVSTASSIGIEGLTATVAAGTLSNGAGSLVYNISGTPSSAGNAIFNLSLGGQSCTVSLVISTGTSGTATHAKDTVVINYFGASAAISNPYQNDGVAITLSGADVTVKSTNVSKEIVYLLSGNANKGSFKLYSEYRYNITMKGVNITNSTGPAVNIQSSKKGTINIVSGSSNTLVDGVTYSTSTEDQKGTFFSEGQLDFMGAGTLTVTGNNKHGIVADDYIAVIDANIIIKSAVKDGIHANDYFLMDNGTVTVTTNGDGIVAEEGYVAINGGTINVNSVDDGISAPYEGTDANITPYLLIKGGKITVNTSGEKGNALKSKSYTTISTIDAINLNVSGKGAKGIKTGGDFTLNAGTVKITNSGAAYYNTTDVAIASTAGINCDKNLKINGGDLTITCTGQGGKGINVDGTATVGGGTTNISASGAKFTYSSSLTSEAKGFKSDGAFVMNNGELNISAADDGLKSGTSVTVNNGTINVTKSFEGMESIFININGGVTNLTASNDGINTSYGTISGGTESNDGSNLTVGGGVLIVTGSDGVDVNGNFFIKGGMTIVSGNEGIDINGNFIISGGTIISSGPNSNMTKSMSAASTQVSMFIKSSASLAATSLIHIEDAAGKDLATYKPKSAAAIFHFSSPSLAKNTAYKIYYGGTYTGGSFSGNSSGWGLYTGGTYSSTGATLKSSPTTSSSAAVNALTF